MTTSKIRFEHIDSETETSKKSSLKKQDQRKDASQYKCKAVIYGNTLTICSKKLNENDDPSDFCKDPPRPPSDNPFKDVEKSKDTDIQKTIDAEIEQERRFAPLSWIPPKQWTMFERERVPNMDALTPKTSVYLDEVDHGHFVFYRVPNGSGASPTKPIEGGAHGNNTVNSKGEAPRFVDPQLDTADLERCQVLVNQFDATHPLPTIPLRKRTARLWPVSNDAIVDQFAQEMSRPPSSAQVKPKPSTGASTKQGSVSRMSTIGSQPQDISSDESKDGVESQEVASDEPKSNSGE